MEAMKIKFLGIEFDDKELTRAMKIAKSDIKNDKGRNTMQKRRKLSDKPLKAK
jgi:hypothetical protein